MVSLSEGQIVGRVVACIVVFVGAFVLLALVGSARKWTYRRYIPVGVPLATIYTVILCRVVLLPWTFTLAVAGVATAIMSFIMIVRARVGEPVRGTRRRPQGVHHDQH